MLCKAISAIAICRDGATLWTSCMVEKHRIRRSGDCAHGSTVSEWPSPTHVFLTTTSAIPFVFYLGKWHLGFIYFHFRQDFYRFIMSSVYPHQSEDEANSTGAWVIHMREREQPKLRERVATKAGRGDGGDRVRAWPRGSQEDLWSRAKSRPGT